MKVIFLDADGVLNTAEYRDRTDDAGEGLNAEVVNLAIDVLNGKLQPVPKESLRDRLRRIFRKKRKERTFDDLYHRGYPW